MSGCHASCDTDSNNSFFDGKSCVLYAIHPDIVTDEFLKGKLQECVDYIRDNYDMERFTEI